MVDRIELTDEVLEALRGKIFRPEVLRGLARIDAENLLRVGLPGGYPEFLVPILKYIQIQGTTRGLFKPKSASRQQITDCYGYKTWAEWNAGSARKPNYRRIEEGRHVPWVYNSTKDKKINKDYLFEDWWHINGTDSLKISATNMDRFVRDIQVGLDAVGVKFDGEKTAWKCSRGEFRFEEVYKSGLTELRQFSLLHSPIQEGSCGKAYRVTRSDGTVTPPLRLDGNSAYPIRAELVQTDLPGWTNCPNCGKPIRGENCE